MKFVSAVTPSQLVGFPLSPVTRPKIVSVPRGHKLNIITNFFCRFLILYEEHVALISLSTLPTTNLKESVPRHGFVIMMSALLFSVGAGYLLIF